MKTAALFALAMAVAGSAHAGMSVSFEWGPTRKCFDTRSPPFSVTGVPTGTVKLHFQMTDMNAPDFHHGGGTVVYGGQNQIPYGAFGYKGPCPPEGSHNYRFDVQALDGGGKMIGKAKAYRKFP